jgi:cleavage and polyadenylation specificity factor subunit 3
MIKFLPLGGAEEVGANSYYLNFDGAGILLDCGMHPRKRGAECIPQLDLLDELPLDFVIISHAHSDHIGALPFLIRKFPHVRIFCTTQTKQIASITLHNSASLLKEQLNGSQLNPYSHEEVDLLVKSIIDYSYEVSFEVTGLRQKSNDGIKVSFYDAGHILGSAGILIEYKNERIFYTGDIKLSPQVLLTGAEIPKKGVSTLLMEATYGAVDPSNLNSWKSELYKFAQAANKILTNGGSILIPIFALGKTQELLAGIFSLLRTKKLTDTRIYTAGIGRKISRVYDLNRYLVKRSNVDLELGSIEQENLYEVNSVNQLFKKNGIILAPGGMLDSGTASKKLVRHFLKQKKSAVFIVGYIDPQSPGYKLLNVEIGDSIRLTENEQPIKVNCQIVKYNFPSHSNRDELLQIVKNLNPTNIILLHGDNEAISKLGYGIISENPNIKLYSSKLGKEICLQ